MLGQATGHHGIGRRTLGREDPQADRDFADHVLRREPAVASMPATLSAVGGNNREAIRPATPVALFDGVKGWGDVVLRGPSSRAIGTGDI